MSTTIVKISAGTIMADRKLYSCDVRYQGDKRSTTITFQGPARGTGPVTMGLDGYTAFVTQPERFGAEFNREWCERFFTTPIYQRGPLLSEVTYDWESK